MQIAVGRICTAPSAVESWPPVRAAVNPIRATSARPSSSRGPGSPTRQPALRQRRRGRVGAAGEQQSHAGGVAAGPDPLRRAAGRQPWREHHHDEAGDREVQPGLRVVDADHARRDAEAARQREQRVVVGPHPHGLRPRAPAESAQALRDRARGAPLGIRARPAALDGAQLVGDLLRIHPGAGQ
jgi:hypothetical protein